MSADKPALPIGAASVEPAINDRAIIVPDGDPRDWLRRELRPLSDAETVLAGSGRGDYDLNPNWKRPTQAKPVRDAAVLLPIVERPEGLTVLLTLRSAHLSSHAGQVAFPGGRIDPTDDGPVAAALRETREETGIEARFVTPVGLLDWYETGSAFRILPVVGVLKPGFEAVPNPGEVDDIFEVPFGFLMDVANHQSHIGMWQGMERRYYAMPYENRHIWGATAGMIVNLRDRLLAPR